MELRTTRRITLVSRSLVCICATSLFFSVDANKTQECLKNPRSPEYVYIGNKVTCGQMDKEGSLSLGELLLTIARLAPGEKHAAALNEATKCIENGHVAAPKTLILAALDAAKEYLEAHHLCIPSDDELKSLNDQLIFYKNIVAENILTIEVTPTSDEEERAPRPEMQPGYYPPVGGASAGTENLCCPLPKDIHVNGTLTVNGDTNLNTLTVNGNADLKQNLAVEGALSVNGNIVTLNNNELELFELAPGTNFVGLKAPATVTSSYTMTFPATQGSLNDSLINDGFGNLAWANPVTVNAFVDGGNAFGNDATLGTIDDKKLFINTHNTARIEIANTGEVTFTGNRVQQHQTTLTYGTSAANSLGFVYTNASVPPFGPTSADRLNFSFNYYNTSPVPADIIVEPTYGTSQITLGPDTHAGTVGGAIVLGTSATNNTVPTPRLSILNDGTLVLESSNLIAMGTNPYIHNTGTNNFYAGELAGNISSTGTDNTAIGSQAATTSSSGNRNTAIGVAALTLNHGGDDNIAIGYQALSACTAGSTNIGIGRGTLLNLISGSDNIAIGDFAGSSVGNNGIGNIYIDNAGAGSDANAIRIGSTQTTCFVSGIRGVTTNLNDAITVLVSSDGQLGTVSSSIRFKENVSDLPSEERFMSLRPVNFNYKNDSTQQTQFGLIAEEVASLYPELIVRDADGAIDTVKYHLLFAILIKEIQENRKLIKTLENRIASLE